MDTLFNEVKSHFNKYQNDDGIEFEIRIGRMNNNMFDTNVGKPVFDKILRALEKYTEWEEVKETSQSVYYKDNIRVTVDDDTEESVCIKKIPIIKETLVLEGRPLDVRFAVSHEEPYEQSEDEVMDFVRTKKRKSFVRKNLSIDMTVVGGQPDDMDCEEPESYQIELEIINPLKVKNENELYNIIHKVHNILEVFQS